VRGSPPATAPVGPLIDRISRIRSFSVTDLLVDAPAAIDQEDDDDAALMLHALFARRRSIRLLRPGPFAPEARERLLAAVRHTPASYNLPPWHVVLVHERRDALWAEIATGFRQALADDRLDRYLERLAGFASGVAVGLVFVDSAVERTLSEEKGLTPDVARTFVQQALGMVQLALWLAVTAEGMASSLQHWDDLVGPRLARFAGLDPERFQLVATMPIGYAAEEPREIARTASSGIA
jgi:hypothetical protein